MLEQLGSENGFLKRTARELRQNATPAEAQAWAMLRGKNLQGLKFRRQHIINGFIVDFYCHALQLCLELDGSPHWDAEGIARDQERDTHLIALGYKVLHINNDVVLNDPQKFRTLILRNCPPLSPPR